jgi:tetratricopeptide (TPR) repeat protein
MNSRQQQDYAQLPGVRVLGIRILGSRRPARNFARSCLVISCALPFSSVAAQPVPRATEVKYFSADGGGLPPQAMMRSAPQTSVEEQHARQAYQLNEQGVELIFQGRREEGQKKIQAALDQDPNNPTAMYNLAGLKLADSKPREAIRLMEQALALRPNDLAFLNRLAESHFANSDIGRAADYYQKIVDRDPGYGEALLRLGTLRGMLRDWSRAEEALRRAVQLHPNDGRALSNFGSVLILREKFAEAVEVLQSADKAQHSGENQVALGIAYEALGKKDKALQSYQAARALGHKDAELDQHIAELTNQSSPSPANNVAANEKAADSSE